MKRKLVEYEVFEKMRETSMTTSIKELVEAEEHLARALNVDSLKLNSFDDSMVIYETADGNFVRANYEVAKSKINFEDVEELVIDEESIQKETKGCVANMLEAILEDNQAKASDLFGKYMDMASDKRKREGTLCTDDTIEEGFTRLYGTRGKAGKPKLFNRSGSKNSKKSEAAKKGHKAHKASYIKGGKKRHSHLNTERSRRKNYSKFYGTLKAKSGGTQYTGKRKMAEWLQLSGHVFSYLEYTCNGHVINESVVQEDGGKLNISIPVTTARNEGKILKMQFDLLKTDVKILRENARRLSTNQQFCMAIADVKRHNNLSDDAGLEESINKLVTTFPSVLYLTQEELAQVIGTALNNVGVKNYSDNTCTFMAEGILRVAHEAFTDRVDRIKRLANQEIKESDDKYADFQAAIKNFFPQLDESTQLELKMFEDLYNASLDVRKLALECENEVVKNEAQEFASELAEILNGKIAPDLELAAEIAEWLETLAETNLEMGTWDVVKTPHKTTTGDHPQMNKNAKKGYSPSADFSGDWGNPAPMIDGDKKGYKGGAAEEAQSKSWSFTAQNHGGLAKNIWPNLQNPIYKDSEDVYKIKGEKAIVDDNDDLGTWQSSDTWAPEGGLQNPYLPKSFGDYKQKVQPDNSVE
jgi:hypothetical protein